MNVYMVSHVSCGYNNKMISNYYIIHGYLYLPSTRTKNKSRFSLFLSLSWGIVGSVWHENETIFTIPMCMFLYYFFVSFVSWLMFVCTVFGVLHPPIPSKKIWYFGWSTPSVISSFSHPYVSKVILFKSFAYISFMVIMI